MKKVFIISTVITILGLVVLVAYNIAFKDGKKITKESIALTEDKEAGKEQESENENEKLIPIRRLTEDGAINPVLVDNKYVQFFNEKGEIIRITLDGAIKSTVLGGSTAVSNAFWAPEKEKVIFQEQDGNGDFYLLDYKTREKVNLKKGLDTVVWTNLQDKIIYKYFNSTNNERTINLANPDGSDWKVLGNLDGNFKNMKIAPVPQTSVVSFWNYPEREKGTSLKIVNIIGGESKEIISGHKGADFLWSPDGNQVLVSFVEDGRLVLGVYDDNGGNFVNLRTPTLVSKCAWFDAENIICAVPMNIPGESILPDDYLAGKLKTRDIFWKINIKNGKKERMVEEEEGSEEEYDASNIILSLSGDRFFFVNQLDNQLYMVLR